MGGDLADQDKPHIETHILLLSLVNFPTSGFEFPSFKLELCGKEEVLVALCIRLRRGSSLAMGEDRPSFLGYFLSRRVRSSLSEELRNNICHRLTEVICDKTQVYEYNFGMIF